MTIQDLLEKDSNFIPPETKTPSAERAAKIKEIAQEEADKHGLVIWFTEINTALVNGGDYIVAIVVNHAFGQNTISTNFSQDQDELIVRTRIQYIVQEFPPYLLD